jgi:hypothetical protein
MIVQVANLNGEEVKLNKGTILPSITEWGEEETGAEERRVRITRNEDDEINFRKKCPTACEMHRPHFNVS